MLHQDKVKFLCFGQAMHLSSLLHYERTRPAKQVDKGHDKLDIGSYLCVDCSIYYNKHSILCDGVAYSFKKT